MVFNKIDQYTYEPYDDFSIDPKNERNYTLEEFENSWMSKENTPCIFISATEKQNIEKFRQDLLEMITNKTNNK